MGITPKLVALLQRLLSLGPVLVSGLYSWLKVIFNVNTLQGFDGNIDLQSEEEDLELTLRKWQPSNRSLSSKADGSICDTVRALRPLSTIIT